MTSRTRPRCCAIYELLGTADRIRLHAASGPMSKLERATSQDRLSGADGLPQYLHRGHERLRRIGATDGHGHHDAAQPTCCLALGH